MVMSNVHIRHQRIDIDCPLPLIKVQGCIAEYMPFYSILVDNFSAFVRKQCLNNLFRAFNALECFSISITIKRLTSHPRLPLLNPALTGVPAEHH